MAFAYYPSEFERLMWHSICDIQIDGRTGNICGSDKEPKDGKIEKAWKVYETLHFLRRYEERDYENRIGEFTRHIRHNWEFEVIGTGELSDVLKTQICNNPQFYSERISIPNQQRPFTLLYADFSNKIDEGVEFYVYNNKSEKGRLPASLRKTRRWNSLKGNEEEIKSVMSKAFNYVIQDYIKSFKK
ncbi:MAG: hypothetical protein Q7R52_01340 [archaeon]|nr:hypothetical protein [archaeon]